MDRQPLLNATPSRGSYEPQGPANGKEALGARVAVAKSVARPIKKNDGEEFRPQVVSLATDHSIGASQRETYQGMSGIGPFERLDPDPGPHEFFKMLLLGTTLLPLRLAAALAILVSYYFLSMAYIALNPRKKYSRGTLRGLSRLVARSILFACGFHYVEVFGDKTVRDDTMIIVSNHVSIWEILFFMSSPSCPSFVFKSDCLKVPFIGEIALKVLQGIKIDRDVAGGGTKAMLSAVQRMKVADSPDEYRPLLVFPEGTTGNGSSLLCFRSGSFVPGVTVKPVVIHFPFQHFCPSYESIYTSVFIFRTLTQFHNRLQVRYMREYIPSEEEKKDPKLYAENVRTVMAKALCVPKCEANYKEKRMYHLRLGKRIASHPLGWMSNLLYLNPKPLPEEASMDALTYKYTK